MKGPQVETTVSSCGPFPSVANALRLFRKAHRPMALVSEFIPACAASMIGEIVETAGMVHQFDVLLLAGRHGVAASIQKAKPLGLNMTYVARPLLPSP